MKPKKGFVCAVLLIDICSLKDGLEMVRGEEELFRENCFGRTVLVASCRLL